MDASGAMTKYLEHHSQLLIAQGVVEKGRVLSYRGGIATGEIKAVMYKTGLNWLHAGQSIPFVEAARMLQLESEWSHDKNTTYIFLTEAATQELIALNSSINGEWIDRNYRKAAKHGVEYVAGIFKPALGAKVIPIKNSAKVNFKKSA